MTEPREPKIRPIVDPGALGLAGSETSRAGCLGTFALIFFGEVLLVFGLGWLWEIGGGRGANLVVILIVLFVLPPVALVLTVALAVGKSAPPGRERGPKAKRGELGARAAATAAATPEEIEARREALVALGFAVKSPTPDRWEIVSPSGKEMQFAYSAEDFLEIASRILAARCE